MKDLMRRLFAQIRREGASAESADARQSLAQDGQEWRDCRAEEEARIEAGIAAKTVYYWYAGWRML